MLIPKARRVTTLALVFCGLTPLASQAPPRQALVLAVECPGGDCPLLKGAPQTAGMRSGFVRLQPGETVGWHTTGKNEESLVILTGRRNALRKLNPTQPRPRLCGSARMRCLKSRRYLI